MTSDEKIVKRVLEKIAALPATRHVDSYWRNETAYVVFARFAVVFDDDPWSVQELVYHVTGKDPIDALKKLFNRIERASGILAQVAEIAPRTL